MTLDPAGRAVTVVGAGTLGRRIALMWGSQGGEVRLVDPVAEQREAALAYLREHAGPQAGAASATDDLAGAVDGAWQVVECVPERLQAKRDLFAQLDRQAPADAELASNSSSIPSSRFCDVVQDRTRVLNTHFYMPPERNAVELMSCGETAPEVLDLLEEQARAHGLVPFRVHRESVGFIYNRVWAAIKRESLSVVADGVSTPEELDEIYRLNAGGGEGPFRRMDRVGLDVVLDIEEHYAQVRPQLPEGPRRLLREYVERGDLGVKSGRGFYAYDEVVDDADPGALPGD
jgi:3-hydroxybutyryl-CoA dehydrogenase